MIGSGRFRILLTIALAAMAVVGAVMMWRSTHGGGDDITFSGLRAAMAHRPHAGVSPTPDAALHPVHIRTPSGPPVIEITNRDGSETSLSCTVCHSIREPDFTNRTPGDLDEFHQDMPFAHGGLACFSCHNPNDYNTLRLADQSGVAYTEVMTLCAQCHGTQARDYAHGAHGGMSGYWDLSRGPRVRNNCVDCHDPHVPRYPTMYPTFKPRDRFLSPEGSKGEQTHE